MLQERSLGVVIPHVEFNGRSVMQVNGKHLTVERHGEGETVLMVHGLGGTSNTWWPQRTVLSKGFDVICPDLNGSGRSALAEPVSMDSHVADMLELLDACKVKAAHLVGHSMGTIICQHLAARHPERVNSLVLIGPLAEPPAAARKGLKERAALARSEGMVPIADALVEASVSAHTRAHQPAVAAMVRESLMRQHPQGYAANCEALAQAQSAQIESIRCPALLITGDEDKVGPPAATAALARRIPGAKTVLYGATGHWTTIERPHEVSQALTSFLLMEWG